MIPRRRPAAADLRIAGGLAALPLLLFAEAVAGRRVFYERDIHAYWHPKVESFVRVLAQGAWPLWDPYPGFGLPLLADPGSQVLYPFTWLNLVFLPSTVYTLVVVAHAWLAAAGVYALGRAWRLSRAGAALAGLCFAASGPLVSAVSLYHHYMGAAWAPWVLLAVEGVLAERRRRRILLLGAALAMQVLAGSGDMVVLTALAAAVRLLGGLGAQAGGWPRVDGAALARLAMGAMVGLGLSAAQWVPTVALVRRSARSALPAEANLYWSVHPLALAETLVPRALASLPLAETARAALFESREPFLPSLYLGLVPALLLVGLAGTAEPRRALWAAAGVALFLLLALGRHTPVLPALLRLPGLSLFRYPVKYTIGLALFWALLAGMGLDGWRAWTRERRRRLWVVVLAATVVALAAGGGAEWLRTHARELGRWVDAPPEWRPQAYAPLVDALRRAALLALVVAALALARARVGERAFAALAFAAAALDVATAARGVNDLAPPELFAHRPPALRWLEGPPEEHRLYAPPVPMPWLNRSLVRGPAGWKEPWSFALGLQESLQAPIAARWGLRGSYDADFTGLAPGRLATTAAFMARHHETTVGLRLLRMGGVTEVVALERPRTPGLTLVGEAPTPFREPVRALRVPAPFPRAYLVGAAREARGDDALRALGDPGFDPETTVLLESAPRAVGGRGFAARAEVLASRADSWRIRTEATHDAYLVVLDGDDPGWTARVDGRASPVVRANLVVRAVPVPSGVHEVVLSYRPASVLAGLAVTGATLLAVLLASRARAGTPREERLGSASSRASTPS